VGSGGPKSWCVPARGYSGSGRIPLRHSNKWYQSQRFEKTWENISGSHGDGGVRERLRRVTLMVVTRELDSVLG
jgi:hypothetical protein